MDGAVNQAGQDPNGADGEVLLDIEVAGAVAPGAAQVVYFAPNTDQGFVDAVTTAVHASPTPTAVSISWGQSEDSWTAQARTALDQAMADAAALGVTVCVAAGDNGSGDGETDGQPHTDFPASSPHALACGGTSLHGDAGDRGDQLGDGVERRGRPRRHRRRGERHVPAAVLAGVGRGAGPARRWPAPRPAVACPTWPATPTRRPATRCWWTGSRWWSAGPARSPRCGRR